jgi:hypothetical protein
MLVCACLTLSWCSNLILVFLPLQPPERRPEQRHCERETCSACCTAQKERKALVVSKVLNAEGRLDNETIHAIYPCLSSWQEGLWPSISKQIVTDPQVQTLEDAVRATLKLKSTISTSHLIRVHTYRANMEHPTEANCSPYNQVIKSDIRSDFRLEGG